MSAANKVVLASGNQGKIKEIQALLPDFHVCPQHDFAIQEVPETGSTFVENALIKARNAAKQSGLPAIADDSGLVVDALNGAPGIISARYAGVQANDHDNIEKLLLALKDTPSNSRQARFICIIVMLRHADDPLPIIAQGIWEGSILTAIQGNNGFGYDPVFWVADENSSAAELSPARKNQLSHRGKALQDFIQKI